MTTTHTAPVRSLRPFHTPVRGHTFAARPTGGAALDRSPLTLRREPDNPADPYAVAVWADGGGTPWRVGYLERAVAVRMADRLAAEGAPVVASFAGWWEEPDGRWRRPVLRLAPDDGTPPPDRTHRTGVAALPPFRHRGPVQRKTA